MPDGRYQQRGGDANEGQAANGSRIGRLDRPQRDVTSNLVVREPEQPAEHGPVVGADGPAGVRRSPGRSGEAEGDAGRDHSALSRVRDLLEEASRGELDVAKVVVLDGLHDAGGHAGRLQVLHRLETTRRACRKFRQTPTSLINFLEGTRLTPAEHAYQESRYKNLLRPKAGGMAFVINRVRSLLDVTIAYPGGVPNFWDLLAGRLDRVIVHVEERPIPAELLSGDYLGDAIFRARFQSWIDGLWKEKDDRIEELLAGEAAAAAPMLAETGRRSSVAN
jgi:hypothetical protein